jgi:hypothetical protein
LTDTWANISNVANATVVADATAYAISNIVDENAAVLSFADATLLTGASNYSDFTTASDTYSIDNIAAEDGQALTIAQANALTDASNYTTDFSEDTFTLSADTWANIGATANTDIIGLAASYVATITGGFTGDVTKAAGITTMTLSASTDGWNINASDVDILDLVGATIINETYDSGTETIEFTDANSTHQIITLTGLALEMSLTNGNLIV